MVLWTRVMSNNALNKTQVAPLQTYFSSHQINDNHTSDAVFDASASALLDIIANPEQTIAEPPNRPQQTLVFSLGANGALINEPHKAEAAIDSVSALSTQQELQPEDVPMSTNDDSLNSYDFSALNGDASCDAGDNVEKREELSTSFSESQAQYCPDTSIHYHEFINTLCDHLNIPQAYRDTIKPEQFAKEIALALTVSTEGIRSLLLARREIKASTDLNQTIVEQSDNNPLKFSLSTADVLEHLLCKHRDECLTTEHAYKQAVNDIKLHEFSLVKRIPSALDKLFQQLLRTIIVPYKGKYSTEYAFSIDNTHRLNVWDDLHQFTCLRSL